MKKISGFSVNPENLKTTNCEALEDFESQSKNFYANYINAWFSSKYARGVWFIGNEIPALTKTLESDLQKKTMDRFVNIFGVAPKNIKKSHLPLLLESIRALTEEEKGCQLGKIEAEAAYKKQSVVDRGLGLGIRKCLSTPLTYTTVITPPEIKTADGFAFYLRHLMRLEKDTVQRKSNYICDFAIDTDDIDRAEAEKQLAEGPDDAKHFAKQLLVFADLKDLEEPINKAQRAFEDHIGAFCLRYENSPYIKTLAPFYTRIVALDANFRTSFFCALIQNQYDWNQMCTHPYEIRAKMTSSYENSPSQKELQALIRKTTESLVRDQIPKQVEIKVPKQEEIQEKPQAKVVPKKTIKTIEFLDPPKKNISNSKPKVKPQQKEDEEIFSEDASKLENIDYTKEIEVCSVKKPELIPYEFYSSPPVKYSSRVTRWFNIPPNTKFDFEDYKGVNDSAYLEKVRLRHAFSPLVDHLAFDPTYVIVDESCRHLIVAIEYEGHFDIGITSYHFLDKEHTLCDHRFHSLRSPSEFLSPKLDEALSLLMKKKGDSSKEKFVSNPYQDCKDTISINPHSKYATIKDNANNVTIYVFNKI